MPPASITVLDLFAGAGGLTQGFHEADERFQISRAVELDMAAAATYEANFPGKIFAGPIQEWLEKEEPPEVDVVVGGPPCQGFSLLGLRDPDDERNQLWKYFAETLRRSKPRYFVMENVPPFKDSVALAAFTEMLSDATDSTGYRVRAYPVNAADYGSPQRRRRIIVLGSRRDVRPLALPEVNTVEHKTVREAFAEYNIDPKVLRNDLDSRTTEFEGKTLQGPFLSSELHLGRDYQPVSLERFENIPRGGNRFNLPDHLLAECWRNHTSGSGDVMGRLRWDEPSVTIRTEFFKPEKGRYLHPEEHRAITHFEAVAIQGFPADFKWVGSKTAIARQIGNAVPIALGRALGRQIRDTIDADRRPEYAPADVTAPHQT